MAQTYIYIRWSSGKQSDGDSLQRQRELCAALIARNGWSTPIEIIDKAVSAWRGDNLHFGELAKFADRVRSGEVPPGSILCVEKIDRLSRIDPMDAFRWVIEMTNLGLRIATAMDDTVYDREGFPSRSVSM